VELLPGGPEAGQALCGDPRVSAIHFTGSTRTGRAIASAMAERLGRCSLELGGLNYAIVCADADLEHAADCIVAAAVSINGQKCTSTRRVLVESPAAGEVERLLAERLEALSPGDPRDAATSFGPLIRPAAREDAEQAVRRAVSAGARLVGESPEHAGPCSFRATLLADVVPGDPLRGRELFAPVLTLGAVPDLDTALAEASSSAYGLTAAVHSSHPDSLALAAERLPTGILALNRRGDAVELEAPFGGWRDSGFGAPEGGLYAYAGVTALQAVYGADGLAA
jgi:benzaldehyde dehydrogenase (NAD)